MIIEPLKHLRGEITVPGDKSISHRAVMLGAIAQGTTEIDGFLMGEDCLHTIQCFQKLGIQIDCSKDKVLVCGKGLHGLTSPSDVLYTGNSGTTTRLMLGLLAGQNFTAILDGDDSIRKRPMDRVITPLKEMGADITGTQAKTLCPLTVTGTPLKGITYRLPIASAQVKSALLLAALYSEGKTHIIEPAKSRDHSERMLTCFGADIDTAGLDIHCKPYPKLEAQKIRIPGDISSAAYFIVAGLIVPHSEITIKNVGMNPTRTGIIDVLYAMGAKIQLSNQMLINNEPVADITVSTSSLRGTVIEGDIIPRLIDEIPIIAVAAASASGRTIIKDATELKVKESNRIQTVVTELQKAGVNIEETDDGMIISGGNGFKATCFESYNDHRIAMAMGIAALCADTPSTINRADAVGISFPNYFELLKALH